MESNIGLNEASQLFWRGVCAFSDLSQLMEHEPV